MRMLWRKKSSFRQILLPTHRLNRSANAPPLLTDWDSGRQASHPLIISHWLQYTQHLLWCCTREYDQHWSGPCSLHVSSNNTLRTEWRESSDPISLPQSPFSCLYICSEGFAAVKGSQERARAKVSGWEMRWVREGRKSRGADSVCKNSQYAKRKQVYSAVFSCTDTNQVHCDQDRFYESLLSIVSFRSVCWAVWSRTRLERGD